MAPWAARHGPGDRCCRRPFDSAAGARLLGARPGHPVLGGQDCTVGQCGPRGLLGTSGPTMIWTLVISASAPTTVALRAQATTKVAIIAMSSCSRLWQCITYRPG